MLTDERHKLCRFPFSDCSVKRDLIFKWENFGSNTNVLFLSQLYLVQPKNKGLLIAFFRELKNILNLIDLNFCRIDFVCSIMCFCFIEEKFG